MFVRARRAAPLLAALALLAAGCGSSGGSKPVSLPTVSQSSGGSPSASATPTPANDKAAVEAVVDRYYNLLNGPTSPEVAQALYALMTPKCKCRRVPDSLKAAVAKHRSYFGRASVNHKSVNIDGPRLADVLVDYDYTRGGQKDAEGHVVEATAGRRGVVLDFRLLQASGQWLIADVLIVGDGKPA